MENKPTLASDYSAAGVQLAHSASLYIATKLGDLRDELVIVGGLVPSLIVPQGQLAADRPLHVGTMDVDLGLAIAFWMSSDTTSFVNVYATPGLSRTPMTPVAQRMAARWPSIF
jgi:hypothetical protein